jgi:hypothetical protein
LSTVADHQYNPEGNSQIRNSDDLSELTRATLPGAGDAIRLNVPCFGLVLLFFVIVTREVRTGAMS